MKDYWGTPLFIFIILYGTGQSSNTQKDDLTCVNDYLTNISCVWWNYTLFSNQRCELKGIWGIQSFEVVTQRSESDSSKCELEPLNNQSISARSCFLIFNKDNFFYRSKFWLSVSCNESLITKLHFQPSQHIKTNPPDKPLVNGDNITWSKGNTFPEKIENYEFQLQFKAADTSWEKAEPRVLQESYARLGHDLLTVGKDYQARVRVKPVEPRGDGYIRGEWSDWSPAVTWRSEIGKLSVKPEPEIMPVILIIGYIVVVSLILVVLSLIIFIVKKRSRTLKSTQHVPDPSKYFQPLHTIHGGNFQNWLGSQNSATPFLTPQSCDDISPVEVSQSWDVSFIDPDAQIATAMLVHANQVDSGLENSGTSQVSSSGFSNMGYFYSKSRSGSLHLESCPVYFTYHPDKGTSSSLSSCHSLQSPSYQPEQPMSPDSGFDMHDEQHFEEDQDDENLHGAETTVAEGHALVSFIMSLSQGGGREVEAFTPVPVFTAWSELERAPSCASVCEPAEGAPLRPCSMIEPCGSGYLTLKEMQKYSNKSI